MRAARDTWLNPAVALALCAAGGAVFAALRTPLPWMIGPLVVMAACNFAGARLRPPGGGRQLGQLVIGTALGLYFTPAVARELASYWALLVAAALFAIALGWACGWFLTKVTDTDRTTAFFASVPGGAAEMAVLGERFGGRIERIALAQSLRVLVVVIVVPFALTYGGAQGAEGYRPVSAAFSVAGLAALFLAAAAASAVLALVRVSNAFMFGSLLAAIGLTAGGVELSSIPAWITNLGQLLLGCALGSRFERRSLARLGPYAAAVFASILAAIVLAGAFGAGLAWASGVPAPTLILATAPGGIAEMCITAKVLQLGVPLVTAAHVTRVVVLMAASAPLYRLAKWLSARRRAG